MFGRALILKFAICLAVICAGSMLVYGISQESPIGSLSGKVVALESGVPLQADVRLSMEGSDKYYHLQAEKDGTFAFNRLPAGTYTLDASTKVHTLQPMPVQIEEGKTVRLNLELKPNEPNLDLLIHQHIFTPDERPQVTCQGFVPGDTLDVRLFKVDVNAFLVSSGGSLGKLLGKESYGDNSAPVNLDGNPALTLAKSLAFPITRRDFEGVFTQRMNLPLMEPGIYVAEAKTGAVQNIGWIMVTSLGMVTKTAGRQVIAYTVDLKTGAPVASSQVTLYVGDKTIVQGKTNSEGLLNLALPADVKGESQQTILARNGSSFAFVTEYLSSMENSDKIIYAYTERPVYKPGQTVFFKGIVRQTKDSGYSTPNSLPVTVDVRDVKDTLIYHGTMRTDRFGAYAGSFALNSETATGTYTLTSTIEGQGNGQPTEFRVAAYRKPEFTVKTKFSQARYVSGDTARAKVSANYYFGPPVADAKLHYIIRRTPYWLFTGESDDTDYEGDGYTDYGGYGEVVSEGDTRTDPNGEAVVEFPTTWSQPKEEYAQDMDQQFSVEVAATDKSNQEVTGTANTLVTRGEFGITATPDRYVVEPGGAVNLSIQAMDYDKHPIKGQALSVSIGYEKWSNETQESSFQTLNEQKATTDSSGRASLRVQAKGNNSLQVVVKTSDKRGNKISSTTYVYVYSGSIGNDGESRLPDLQVVTDRKSYNIGDTAKVLINAKNPSSYALVTVEGSRVYEQRLVRITGKSTMVEIPVKSEYKPNFYVGVCFVKNKNFVNLQARAKVSLIGQSLQVKVTPNKSKYQPGEDAVYKIKVTDSNGKPAYAQLSVGVVDEAIYAIADETTKPILDYFYAKRSNGVSTSFSFPQIYLSDPDKAGPGLLKADALNIRIRKKFLDTAFWQPTVTTNQNGEATVKFTMPDNLTTWRTIVRAATLGSSFGESKSTVIAQQDFLVRLETPRFLVQSDHSTIAAVVHNYTGRGLDVNVTLRAPGLSIEGGGRRVHVKDGGVERVEWSVVASRLENLEITATAASGRFGDAMQLMLPVQPHGARREATKVGAIQGTANEAVNLDVRDDSVTGATSIRVHVAPSLASSLLGSVQYLAEYPWGCTEQTTSSFLPDVVLSRSLKQLGVSNPKLEAQLPDMVTKGLFRLYRFQLEDGGWSWCEYGKSDPWMTAYVCYGLIRARDAGFPVNQQVLDSGVGRLDTLFTSVNSQTADQENSPLQSFFYDKKRAVTNKIYMAYVLSMAGKNVVDGLREVSDNSLNGKDMALLALTYANLGRSSDAQAVLDRLMRNATVEPGLMHWSGENRYGDEIEATALGLEALLKINRNDTRAYQIVTWLMQHRQGDAWYSTRDTAMVLYAMSEFFKVSHELNPDFDAEILVNGRSIGRKHFDRATVYEPEFEVVVPKQLTHKGRNSLEIRKTGVGELYYSASVTQYVQNDLKVPTVTGSGLSITRQYYHPSIHYFDNGSDAELGSPVSGANVGDTLLVRLVVTSKFSVSHLLLEDMIPAGCEIVTRGAVSPDEWSYWWVGQDVRDDRIAFYLDEFEPGKRVIEYRMRAGFAGTYHALPTTVFAMYQPEVRATTTETEFNVR